MSLHTPVAMQAIRENSLFELEEAVRSIHGRDTRERSGEAYSTAALCHRRLAMCALLAEADDERFATHLCHSAYARLYFLRAATDNHAINPIYRCASKAFSFIDALAAGQMALAAELARFELDRHDPSVEYEEDFLLHHFLHQLTLKLQGEHASNVEALLLRWEDVTQGKPDSYLAACRALLNRDADDFDATLNAVIAERVDTFRRLPHDEGPKDELRRTEGALFMNGIALLRLAESSGLPTRQEYPTIPRLARVQPGRPAPSPAAWMITG